MPKEALAVVNLREVEQRIAHGETLIRQQEEIIKRLSEQGQDLTEAWQFLLLLHHVLMTMYEYRAFILAELNQTDPWPPV